MRSAPFTTRALAALGGTLVLSGAADALAADAPAQDAPAQDAPAQDAPAAPAEEELPPGPVVSTLDFEAAGYLSLSFADLAVPDVGSLNPVGGGVYVAIRYVPTTFPFHAFFETGTGLFATGTTTGPSGVDYKNGLSAWFFSPGIGLDWAAFRLTLGVGPALVRASHSSDTQRSSSASLAIASEVGFSYRFLEKGPWAVSAGLRYQTVPGAKIEALSLGVQVRFASIAYR